MEEKLLINIDDVMKMLEIGRPTATRLIHQFLGKSYKKNRTYLISRQAFIDWVNQGMR